MKVIWGCLFACVFSSLLFFCHQSHMAVLRRTQGGPVRTKEEAPERVEPVGSGDAVGTVSKLEAAGVEPEDESIELDAKTPDIPGDHVNEEPNHFRTFQVVIQVGFADITSEQKAQEYVDQLSQALRMHSSVESAKVLRVYGMYVDDSGDPQAKRIGGN